MSALTHKKYGMFAVSEKGQTTCQFEEVTMHRCAVAGVVHNECMSAVPKKSRHGIKAYPYPCPYPNQPQCLQQALFGGYVQSSVSSMLQQLCISYSGPYHSVDHCMVIYTVHSSASSHTIHTTVSQRPSPA